MTVAENVAYGLMVKGIGRKERCERAQEALEMVRLPQVAGRKPIQLSPAGSANASPSRVRS